MLTCFITFTFKPLCMPTKIGSGKRKPEVAEGKSTAEKKRVSSKKNEKNSTRTPEKKYEEIHFIHADRPVWNYSLFTDEDIRNFQQGTHYSIYNFLGNKQLEVLETPGTYFAVWAPNATYVSVI